MQVTVTIGSIELSAQLNDSPSAEALSRELPLSGSANVWGDEIYFSTAITLEEADDAVEVVPIGTLAYWPPGKAICLFFGPTPVSQADEPRAYSPVNILGKLEGDLAPLRSVENGEVVTVATA